MAFELFKGLFGGDDYYGSKPVVPDWNTLTSEDAQKEAIKANRQSFAKTKGLATQVNKFNQGQLLDMLHKAIPSYDEMVKAGSDQTLSLLTDPNVAAYRRGEVPKDVQDFIHRTDAAKAVGGGFAWGGAKTNLVMRDFSLASMAAIDKGFEQTQKAISSTEQWLGNMKNLAVPGMFDVTSMFLTPMQQYGISAAEREGQFQHDWLKSQIASAPNPAARGRYDQEMGILGMALSAYSGGAGYTQAYKPNYGGAPVGGGSQVGFAPSYGSGPTGNPYYIQNTPYTSNDLNFNFQNSGLGASAPVTNYSGSPSDFSGYDTSFGLGY